MFCRRLLQRNRYCVQFVCKDLAHHPCSVKNPIVFATNRTLTTDTAPNTQPPIDANGTISNVNEVLTEPGAPLLESLPVSELTNRVSEHLPAFIWYDPSNYVMHGLDIFQTSTSLPWWATFVCAGILIRSTIILPVNIWLQKNMQEFLPVGAILYKNNQDLGDAGRAIDYPRLQKVKAEKKRLKAQYGFGTFHPNKPFLVMGPTVLIMFWSIGKLIHISYAPLLSADFLWLSDLTLPDPLFVLPVINTLLLTAIMQSGVDNGDAGGAMIKRMFGNPLAITGFICSIGYGQSFIPSALLIYWISSNIIGLFVAQLLKADSFRRSVGLKPRAEWIMLKEKFPLTGPPILRKDKKSSVPKVSDTRVRPKKNTRDQATEKYVQHQIRKKKKVSAFAEADEVRKKGK